MPMPRIIKAENITCNKSNFNRNEYLCTKVEIRHIEYFLFYFKDKFIKLLFVH